MYQKHYYFNKKKIWTVFIFLSKQMWNKLQFWKIWAVLTFNCECVYVCLRVHTQKSKEILHSKMMPSAARYIYSTGSMALSLLLHLHLPSVLLCIWVPNSQSNCQPNSYMQPINPIIFLVKENFPETLNSGDKGKIYYLFSVQNVPSHKACSM